VQARLRVGTAAAGPGERASGYLTVGQATDGAPLRAPVHIVRGAADGPVLWAQGACHGDEYDGVRALLRLVAELEPASMRGTLVALPVANLSAYLHQSRTSPIDGKDLNRCYPGSPAGTYTDRLAHLLLETVRSVADAFVECHGGGDRFDVVFYTLHCDLPDGPAERAGEMCRAMGAPIVWQSGDPWLQGSLFFHLHRRGIPAALIEVGGEGRLYPNNVDDTHGALRRLMIHLGMLPEQAPPEARAVRHRVAAADFIPCNRGGLVEVVAGRGALVGRGDPLVRIVDLRGDVVDTVRCPVGRGIVLAIHTYGTVASGGPVALIGRLA